MAPELSIAHARLAGGRLLAPRGAVDAATMPQLEAALRDAVRGDQPLTLDLGDVDVHGGAAIALLLNAVRRTDALARHLRVVCPPGRIRAAIERAGLGRRVELVDRLDETPWPEPDAAAARPVVRPGKRAPTPERHAVLLADATVALEAHYADPDLSLDQVARGIATSSRQLQRILADQAGTTFRAELNAVRMQHAAELLHASDLPIGAIAGRVGHRQAAQFANAFRRHHGVSPSAFRRAAREQAGGAAIVE
jgi:anti-anti-sigma factor